ncbi:MAG: endo-1,4-beta-xylanase, partial [Verrucomicrobiota bacterium]
MAVAAAVLVSTAPQAQAESQHLGCLIPKTVAGEVEFGEGKLFDSLIVQGNWSWKVGRDPGTPESYRWTDPDNEMAFGTDRNMNLKYQGIWYPAQSRTWHTPEVIKEELEKYTRAVFERYYVERGQKIDILRVINEIGADINRRPELEAALLDGYHPVDNPNPVDETGYDWLINLFKMVRGIADEYDPDVKLFINDYGLLGGASIKPGKLIEMINIVNNAEGGPYIDAIGCQAHGLENKLGKTIKAGLDRFADNLDHDVEIYITELDINVGDDEGQLANYKELFPVMWEHPSVTSVALWGFEEGHVWSVKRNAFLVRADGTDRPAMTWLRAYMNSDETAPATSFNFPLDQFIPAGSDIDVQVQANDRDGVTKVDFYVNDVFVGSDSTTYEMDDYGEHNFVASGLEVGEHTLKAIAYDTNGLTQTVEKTISIIQAVAPSEPADLVISPEADAHVRSGSFSDRNYGTTENLVTRKKGGNGRRETFLRFDLSDLPDNIDSVWLELTVNSIKADSVGEVQASLIDNDTWGETTLNYQTRPTPSKTLAIVDGITGPGSIKFFLGDSVSLEALKDGKISIKLEEISSDRDIAYHSREYADDPTLRPQLLVYATPLPPYDGDSPVTDGLVLHLDASTLIERNEGDEVLEWPNLVPGGRSATANNDTAPLFAEGFFNGSDALRFDGIDDWMNIGNLVTESDGAEIFVITQASETDGEIDQRLISAFDTGANDTTAPNWAILREDDSNGNPLAMVPQLKILSGPDLHAAGVKLGRNGNASQNFFDDDLGDIAIKE